MGPNTTVSKICLRCKNAQTIQNRQYQNTTPPRPLPPTNLKPTSFKLKKSLGQNLLTDDQVIKQSLQAAKLSPQDLVIEIGPGTGALTDQIIEIGSKFIAIELDQRLFQHLQIRYQGLNNVTILQGDASRIDIASLIEGHSHYKVLGNLPYYLGSRIIRRFLESDTKPDLLVTMVQREVALNMCAKPGKLNLLGIGVQFFGQPEIITLVPPTAFYPKPKVTSALVRINVNKTPFLPKKDEKGFFSLVRSGFQSPRKQLGGVLSKVLGIPRESLGLLFHQASIPMSNRAQHLSLTDWGNLYAVIKDYKCQP